MREHRMRIRLLASPAMDDDDDDDNVIRIPRRARLAFEVTTKQIILNSPTGDVVLEVKQALREDVTALVALFKSGNLSKEDINMTAYVTSATLSKIKGNKKKSDLYITDQLDQLVMGADPEFCLVDDKGLFVRAANVPNFEKTKKLGHDGDLAELRPDPSKDIATVVKNMADLFKNQGKPIEKYGWRGGATYSSGPTPENKKLLRMGGHIHVGDPPIMEESIKNAIYARIINVLDEYTALPLVRVDTPEASKRRVGHGAYGRYGDQRPQTGRFEYRVPSGFWLLHPEFASSILGTTKAVSEACYQLIHENKFDQSWIAAPSNRKGLLKSMGCSPCESVEKIVNNSNAEDISDNVLSKSVEKLKSLPNYKKYKDYVDGFIDIISLSNQDRKNINLDLKETWLAGKHFVK